MARRLGMDAVVGFGGGAVLDLAKAVAACAPADDDVAKYVKAG